MRKEIPARVELTCDLCSKVYDIVDHEHYTVEVKVRATTHGHLINRIVDLCYDCGENFIFDEWDKDIFGIKSGGEKF